MSDFEEIYEYSVMISKNLFEDIRFSRQINFDHIKIGSEKICDYLYLNANILIMLHSVEDKNPYLYSHPVKVAFISYAIGKWMNLGRDELSRLVCTGIVHDIGKAKVRDSILNKPEKLTEAEMNIMKNHPLMGYRILTGLNVLDTDILLGVLSHHERQNGTGYPRNQIGDQINKFGKILAIADIYDAMTSKTPYHDKVTPFKAIEEIYQLSFGLLDPQICQVFLKNMSNFYYGSVVRLNDERVGEIVYVNQEERTKPLIHCEDEYINLTQERNLEIVEMLN
jgi:HD-GYP domain-containing protein (c-di-GMP phosphodiesterase class II)